MFPGFRRGKSNSNSRFLWHVHLRARHLLLLKSMTPVTAGWVAPEDGPHYEVKETEHGWMLVLRDGPVTLTQVFDSAPAAEAEALALALLLIPVNSRPH
jgi:hypothetical protein